MKERPILFSAPMVRAILADRKTQTRRLLNVQDEQLTTLTELGVIQKIAVGFGEGARWLPFKYGTVGDRLWVKETWKAGIGWDNCKPTDIGIGACLQFAADGKARCADDFDFQDQVSWGKTRTPLFMRRWMSRITLEITAVRVERLQAITEADAEAEGVDFLRHHPDSDETLTAVQLYKVLWEWINGEGSWALNPWVWIIEFRRLA